MHFYSYPYLAYPYTHPSQQAVNGHPRPPHSNESPFPPVETEQLHASAKGIQEIMGEARLLIDKIESSPDFAYEPMSEAQQSNHRKVDALIASTGITVKVSTKYTPTGIHIKFDNSKIAGGCCKLELGLLW